MNFKRISMITVLAAAQVSMAFPVAAESPDVTAPALNGQPALQSPVEGQGQANREQQTDLQQAEETPATPTETPSDSIEGTTSDPNATPSEPNEQQEDSASDPSDNEVSENEEGSRPKASPKSALPMQPLTNWCC